ncbi:MAG: transporter substrate-binding domain-containing protein [Clostridia bacterium]|nr:transporter substrate-binding domain-containing protein [Clostridia bacterium]
MKKTMAIALVLIMMMSVVCVAHADMLSDIQAKGVLVLGANIEFPPYEFYWTNPETGAEEIAGFDMDLARGIAQQLGVELQINDQAFSGLVTALSIGEMDMVISGLAIKPERLEVVDFSDPYFSGEQILLVRAEDYDKYLTAEDLAGKKVGAQLGSLQQGILESQFAKSEPLLLDKPSVLALELMQGNIDGWLITDLVAMQYMVVYPDMFQISQVPVDYDSSAGIGVAVTKGDNASLLEIVNQYIAQVHADGTWDAWMADAVAKSASLLSE